MPSPLLSRIHDHRAAFWVVSHLVPIIAILIGIALTSLFRSQLPLLIAGFFAFAAVVWTWGIFLIVLWYGPDGFLRPAFIDASPFWIAWFLKLMRFASFLLLPVWFAIPLAIPLALLV